MSLDLTPWARRGIDDAVPFFREMSRGGRLSLSRRGPLGDYQAKWVVGGAFRGAARDPDPLHAAVRAIRGGDVVPPSVASADAISGTE